MSANALETMFIPIVRGLFLVVMLGAAGRGLVRMLAIVAGAWHPGDTIGAATTSERPDRPRGAEVDRLRVEDELAAVIA